MNNKLNNQLMSQGNTLQFRGLSIIMVVLSHYAEWWSWFLPSEGALETLRLACTKLGIYGVDLFFLFSGYAMIKSWKGQKIGLSFVIKRVKSIYIPYLIVAGLIQLLSGGFPTFKAVYRYLIGYDFWFMTVIFVFNIAFLVIYKLAGRYRILRVALFCVFTYGYSWLLYRNEMHDFWYLSNITFALGIILSEYEEGIWKVVKRIREPLLIMTGLAMVWVVWSGLWPVGDLVQAPDATKLLLALGATVLWSVFIILYLAGNDKKVKTLVFLGRNSLYIYLTHTFIFMFCVNQLSLSVVTKFIIGAIATIPVSWGLNVLINKALYGFKRTKGEEETAMEEKEVGGRDGESI